MELFKLKVSLVASNGGMLVHVARRQRGHKALQRVRISGLRGLRFRSVGLRVLRPEGFRGSGLSTLSCNWDCTYCLA